MVSRRLLEPGNLVRDGRWCKNIGEELFGSDVHGKTLGILGELPADGAQ
jgi:gluconate 2-dehydrogenase